MIDYYLKVSSEKELNNILVQAELASVTDEGLALADGVALDIIGEIPDVTGFHANVRVFKDLEEWQVAGLEQHNVTVNSPYRIWA